MRLVLHLSFIMIIVTIIKLVLFIFHVKSALFIQAALDICENLHRVSSFKYLAERKGLFSPNAGREAKLEGFYCRVWLAFLFTVNLRKAFSGKETG